MTRYRMAGWKIGPASVCLLGGMILLMLLIVVLPDVDLPDAAFHRGTAPVVVHTQATSAPTTLGVAVAFQLPFTPESLRYLHQQPVLGVHSGPNFRPIFLRSIRC